MKIIFMGSPSFAVPALERIINSDHEILAVYTQPPKPSGRGYKLTPTIIHEIAERNNLLVKTPKTLRSIEAQREFVSFNADIAVVVAYGLILPQEIIDSTKYGCINIHPSDLPKYRGAAPLQRTILSGDKKTSVCIIQMDNGVDTGDILLKQDLDLPDDIKFQQLHDLTANLGADMVMQVLDNYHDLIRLAQSNIGSSYAHKISKEESMISFDNDDIYQIDRKVRALNPVPGCFFYYQDKKIKLQEVKIEVKSHQFPIGTIIDSNFGIAVKGGIIYPLILQKEGKQKLEIEEFIRGNKVVIGEKIL